MIIPTANILNRRYATLFIFVLAAVYTWLFFGPTIASIVPFAPRGRGARISRPSDYEVFDPEPIQKICNEVQWTQGLIFTCEESGGGVGNLRNSILNCVRYTIGAGGALVLPRIVVRDEHDITKIWNSDKTGLEYIFDVDHFIGTLNLACPQLTIFPELGSVPGTPAPRKDDIRLRPEELFDRELPRTGIPDPWTLRERLLHWLETISVPEISVKQPAIVNLRRSYIQYPVYTDGLDFAQNFGIILRFRADAYILADKVLLSLARAMGKRIDLREPIIKDFFFGAHLRTERDSQAGWPPNDWEYSRFDTQSHKYLEQAPRSNVSVIFVASGDRQQVQRFAVDAAEKGGYLVTTKFDILPAEDVAQLRKFSWDQMALVDYLVMLRATDFAGVAHSSFAWNIALRRHLYSSTQDHLRGPQMLSDELSQVYGEPGKYPEYAACMWP